MNWVKKIRDLGQNRVRMLKYVGKIRARMLWKKKMMKIREFWRTSSGWEKTFIYWYFWMWENFYTIWNKRICDTLGRVLLKESTLTFTHIHAHAHIHTYAHLLTHIHTFVHECLPECVGATAVSIHVPLHYSTWYSLCLQKIGTNIQLYFKQRTLLPVGKKGTHKSAPTGT